MMFLPVLGFGIAIGALYSLFGRLIRHHDIHVAFATVAFWLSMYLFERSWGTMLGVTLGLMVYLGAPVVLLDRFLLRRSLRQQELLDAPLSDGRTSGAY
jgi:ABC-type enterobactin transport system permease subunit